MTNDKCFMSAEVKKVVSVSFSPTRSSYTVARSISEGTNLPVVEFDVTHTALEPLELSSDTLLVLAMPVYGGAIPDIAKERIKALKGNGTPSVIVAVYGNRNFDKALLQMRDFIAERGFVAVAAGAFVGEHSYSTDAFPIAVGRPDAEDRADARKFGAAVMGKLYDDGIRPVVVEGVKAGCSGLSNVLGFARFVLGYRRRQKKNPQKTAVETDASLCTGCGICVEVCPVDAIAPGAETKTDMAKCIRCCACVKNCPVKARKFDSPFAPVLSKYFAKQKRNVVCTK